MGVSGGKLAAFQGRINISNKDSVTVPGPSARFGWIMFDWASQPFYTLIVTFLFAPYFANYFVKDAVLGQTLWGYSAAIAGIGIAILSPIFGAVSDVSGKRKPWIAWGTFFMAAAMTGLWLAAPGMPDRVYMVMGFVIVAMIAGEVTLVFINAMMPSLTTPEKLGELSGTGWAIGFVGGLMSLLFMLGFIIVDPDSGKTVIGLAPVLPFDAAEHQHDRFVGPFSALWLIIFSMPFFILTPDLGSSDSASTSTLRDGLEQLKQTFKELGKYINIVIFLIARMIYNDGLTAIFTFGGIYATAIFDWSLIELGLFGIILILVGAIGAYFGGKLDDRLGSKTLILGCLILLLLASIGILSVDQNRIFFVVEVPGKSEGALPLSSTGELVYLAFACIVGLVGGPLQASSRTLLARLSPPDKLSEFFGLYAFSGKITAFMAPFVVATVTGYFGDQRLGIATVLIFLVVGFVMMLWVRSSRD